MKKILLTLAALGALSALSLAQDSKKAPEAKKVAEPTTIKCAVNTGDDVNIKEATAKKMYTDYKGRRYFFCCASCPTAFAKNPKKYAKAASIPTPKAQKKGKTAGKKA